MMLPASPSKNKYGLKLSFETQNTVAPLKIRMFTMRYEVNVSRLQSNPTLSLVKVLVRIPFVVKEIGVITANRTGTQVGHIFVIVLAFSTVLVVGGFMTPARPMTIVQTMILIIPIKW